jgi:acylphosphatase
MPDPNEMTRLHVSVRGRVQGVGFRAHVEHAARALALTGWVRNVGYDQVEAVAEGAKSALQQLEQAIRGGPRGSGVDEATVEWLDATGEFGNFAVRRSV